MQELVVGQSATGEADFDALIGPHLDSGYRTAIAILRDPHEARDAVQEAAFRAWRRLGQLHDASSARPWFLAIVANECFSIRRTKWWSVLRVAKIDHEPEAELLTEKTDIERSLAKLPRGDRLALFLYFYLDLPMHEVAAVLRLSEAGARTRVYRAVKKLRPGLEMD